MLVAISIATLLLPLVIGVIAGRLRAFDDPDRAIDALNRFALHVAFPALVIVGLSDPSSPIAHRPAFLAIIPVALAITVLVVRAISLAKESWRGQAGSIALVVAFGNTAYLGLPFVEAVLGHDALATAAVAVAIHVACAMTVGPLLLARWSETGASDGAGSLARLARQPLLWSPLVGLSARALPEPVLEPLRAVLDPLGRTAAPVSMFLLGLYLFAHRARLRATGTIAAHVAARLVLAPLITVALVLAARAWGAIDLEEARVLVVLSAMPAAITTFAIALEQRIGADRVAAAIVVSTLLSAITLPIATCAAMAIP